MRTRTRAPRAAATRSTPSTQTVGHASVSRRPRQALAPHAAQPLRDAPPPTHCVARCRVLVSKEEALGNKTRNGLWAPRGWLRASPGAASCRHSAGWSSPRDQAPLCSVTAGFLRVLFLGVGGVGWPQAAGWWGGGSVCALEGSFYFRSTGVSSPNGRRAGDSFPSQQRPPPPPQRGASLPPTASGKPRGFLRACFQSCLSGTPGRGPV